LDITQEIIDLAIQQKVNLIISHHPVVFKPFLPLNNTSYKGKLLVDATKHNICIYSAHTNADKSIHGINDANAKKLKLKDITFIPPKDMYLYKLSAISKCQDQDRIVDILSKYNCSNITFYLGCDNKLVTEAMITQEMLSHALLGIRRETFEDFSIVPTINLRNDLCNFIIGEIEALNAADFIAYVQNCYQLKNIAVGGCLNKKIKKVAFCGGAGKSFLKEVISYNIDAYITGDVTHHDYQTAYEENILLIDATHYATEKVFLEIISNILIEGIGINKQNITLIEQTELFSKII